MPIFYLLFNDSFKKKFKELISTNDDLRNELYELNSFLNCGNKLKYKLTSLPCKNTFKLVKN
jgi:hypothetical protein